jgi:hypothetical protein
LVDGKWYDDRIDASKPSTKDKVVALTASTFRSRSKITYKRHHDDKIIKAYSLDELASYDQSQSHHSSRQCGRDDGRCESIPTKIRLVVV